MPPLKIRPLTKPDPFELLSDRRYEQHHAELERRILEEEAKLEELRHFSARPVPHPVPFLPKKSTKPLTQVEDFELHSTERAGRRQEWERKLKIREAELNRQRDELRRAREAEELRQQRQRPAPKVSAAVLPLPHHPPPTIRPSNRPLTVPHSPALQTSRRQRKPTD